MSFRQVDSRSRPAPGPSPRRWMVGATVVFGTIGTVAGGIGSLDRLTTAIPGLDQAGVAVGAILGAAVGVVCGLALIGLVRLALRLRRRRTAARRDCEPRAD